MFYKNLKYTLMMLTILGVTGCNQRTITIQPEDRRRASIPRIEPIVPRRVVKEEILINKNPNLGTKVNTSPKNNRPVKRVVVDNDKHDKNIDGDIDKKDIASEVVHNTIIPRMGFPAKEYSRLQKRGRNTVSGTIFLENINTSDKIIGKKVKLYLNPVTSYSEQWYQESYVNGNKLSRADKRLYNYLKFTMSNGSGSYNFFGVPKGEYFLVGTMKCKEECGFDKKKTIRLVERVSVGSGVTNIDLTKSVP